MVRVLPDQTSNTRVVLVAGIVLSIITLLSRLRLLIPVAVVAGLLLGVGRGAGVLQQFLQYRTYVGNDVIVTGAIDGDPSVGRKGISFSLSDVTIRLVDETQSSGVDMIGKVWLRLDENVDLSRYDRVVIQGVADSGFGAYGATLQRAKLIEASKANSDILGKLRNDFSAKLSNVMNEAEVGLGMGILAGQKSVLDEDVQDAFAAASLTHILVASGYNLTVLVRFARRLFAKRSRLLALLLSIGLIILFAGLTGSSASMDRAMAVSVLSLLLWYVGRKMHPVVLLSVVGAATILIDPLQLWGDVGWYLSFGSFAGVIILAPLVNDWLAQLTNRRSTDDDGMDEEDAADLTIAAKLARRLGQIPGSMVQVLVETLSAQVVTLPIIAWFMGEVSLVGMATNIPVLPLLPLAMALTLIAGLGAIGLPVAVARIIAMPARWLLGFIISVAQWGATLPGASVTFQPDAWMVVLYYGVLLVIVVSLWIVTGHNFYGDNVVE